MPLEPLIEYEEQDFDSKHVFWFAGSYRYEATLVRISALGWSSDLRNLPEMNFIQLYDYLVVSTRKYRHIVLKGTHYEKLKSYQFFFEGNVKKLESKVFQNKT